MINLQRDLKTIWMTKLRQINVECIAVKWQLIANEPDYFIESISKHFHVDQLYNYTQASDCTATEV